METKLARIKLFCAECKHETNHDVLKELHEEFSNEDFFGDNKWQIIRCRGCDTTSFRHEWHFSEDQGPDGLLTQVELFPRRGIDILCAKDFYETPRKIRRIYREMIDAYNNGFYTLCAGGLRAIIEGICKIKKIKGGAIEYTKPDGTTDTKKSNQLAGKIAGLSEKKLITEEHANMLHELRFLGNEALHELDQPSEGELNCAVAIVEHTIESIFEIQKKAKQLRELKHEKKAYNRAK
jgi:hypothetical protein